MGAQEVKVHARLTIVPGKASPAGKVHKLSILDHLMQKHYARAVYYFDTSTVQDRAKLIPSLKESLCKALSIYPLFGGRLEKTEDGLWEVKFNDAGVRIYEAVCSVSMQDVLGNPLHGQIVSELYRHEINYDHTITPVAVVQFTEFSCGNLAIGLSWHHGIGDPMCGTLLFKAWGETQRAAQILHPPFFHPPSLKPRPKPNLEVQSRDYYSSAFFNKAKDGDAPQQEYQSMTLRFSHETVEQLISDVQNGSCKFGPPAPSDVLSALLWVAISKAQGKTKGDEAKASLCLEFRKVQLPPLPYGYMGNAIHFAHMSFPMQLLEGNDLSEVARIVSHTGGMVDTEEVRSVVDLAQEMEDQGKGLLRDPPFFYSDGLTIAIFDHFFCYDIVFAFGKAVQAEYFLQPVKGEGHVIILPAAEGKSSRNVVVSLPRAVIGKLLEDVELLRLLPELKTSVL